MVYLVDVSLLITGIIIIAIGAILYAVARHTGNVTLEKILVIAGIVLAIIGIVIVVTSLLIPLTASGLLILGG